MAIHTERFEIRAPQGFKRLAQLVADIEETSPAEMVRELFISKAADYVQAGKLDPAAIFPEEEVSHDV